MLETSPLHVFLQGDDSDPSPIASVAVAVHTCGSHKCSFLRYSTYDGQFRNLNLAATRTPALIRKSLNKKLSLRLFEKNKNLGSFYTKVSVEHAVS